MADVDPNSASSRPTSKWTQEICLHGPTEKAHAKAPYSPAQNGPNASCKTARGLSFFWGDHTMDRVVKPFPLFLPSLFPISSCRLLPHLSTAQPVNIFIRCLHDPANVQQTSSKCIQNTRANALALALALARVFWIHLLEVCWTFAGSCKHPLRLHEQRWKSPLSGSGWSHGRQTVSGADWAKRSVSGDNSFEIFCETSWWFQIKFVAQSGRGQQLVTESEWVNNSAFTDNQCMNMGAPEIRGAALGCDVASLSGTVHITVHASAITVNKRCVAACFNGAKASVRVTN